jgi:hypothetical protein
MRQCFLPGLGMEVDRINQGPVDVEDDCSDQLGFPYLTLGLNIRCRRLQADSPWMGSGRDANNFFLRRVLVHRIIHSVLRCGTVGTARRGWGKDSPE